ncbi:MAG: N-acetylglucosamine-specific PTS transporter subunit IIBC [Francisellaceae bacterium]
MSQTMTIKNTKQHKRFSFQNIQQLGRALMLPIAVLPIAGILLRFGQPDLLNIKAVADAGNAIFANLPILFAIGVAIGFAKANHGAAAMAAVVGFFIMNAVITTIDSSVNTGVLGGIIIGGLAGYLYNKFYDIKLPEYLAFFGGRRFVPIITGIVAVLIGFLFGFVWPPVQEGINIFGNWLIGSGSIGMFLYGFFNRILLMFGLHHILNNLVWFQFGSFHDAAGSIVHGDIARFMAGDPTAGSFMAGFFPIMMFGLPAACFAMYRNAHTHRQKAVAGMLFSIALTAFLTGVTEPIEYSFMFLAPVLYLLHAAITGLSMVVMYILGVKLGFTFSAGFIDYVLFFKMDTHPLYLIPIGIITAVVYYTLFSFFIRKFNLMTIGRDIEAEVDETAPVVNDESTAVQFVHALGGKSNLVNVDACTTRLRLVVVDSSKINQAVLKKLGARGILTPDSTTVQVILGPQAELVSSQINEALPYVEEDSQAQSSAQASKVMMNTPEDIDFVLDNKMLDKARLLIDLLGGANSIIDVQIESLSRIRVFFADEAYHLSDHEQLASFGVLAVLDINDKERQLFVPEKTVELYQALHQVLAEKVSSEA